ncbi:hypothetical protein BP00DRAFT_89450 [Aspergillus indologenus CBS 114.80]|uniref:Uncharacterized protein n=1 Tax=Aspergillus indologenus CBS 114.80 TaxID=1450541 RepID=A0A2V5IB24_9EURO|nr:hypothetical protein BP00DRAFT_89450 [Aspergillus indologenus CBS 114.80]
MKLTCASLEFVFGRRLLRVDRRTSEEANILTLIYKSVYIWTLATGIAQIVLGSPGMYFGESSIVGRSEKCCCSQ